MRWVTKGRRLATAITSVALVLGVSGAASAFTGPDYPSADCAPDQGSPRYGLGPQQWMSSVGLPLTPPSTPLPQIIVLGEFNQAADANSVNNLLQQCGLPTVPTDMNISSSDFPPLTDDPGGEATLDATVVAAGLPPNATMYVVNVGNQRGWYAVFAAAASACGLEFSSSPTSGLPELSKGPAYPAGGCIISLSYSTPESGTESSVADSEHILGQLADLGVIVLVAAGDEGSGGCISEDGESYGAAVLVPVTELEAHSGEWTATTSSDHGFSVGQQGFVGVTDSVTEDVISTTFTVLSTPTPRKFTYHHDTTTRASAAVYGSASVDYGPAVAGYPGTSPHVVAVGGTQWETQAEAIAHPDYVDYEPGLEYSHNVWHDMSYNSNCANVSTAPNSGPEGGGGGESIYFDQPDYQAAAASLNYPAQTQRMVPDIAALGGWPGYGIAGLGPILDFAKVEAGVATVYTRQEFVFSAGQTVEISGLSGSLEALNGSFVLTARGHHQMSYEISSPDIPKTRISPSGLATRSCPSYPCAASEFPWNIEEGTSAATPLVAVGLANVNAVLSSQGLSVIDSKPGSMNVHSIIYDSANASALSDVSAGDNNLFDLEGWSALPGYDMASGMGVPDFATLADLLASRLRPTPTPTPSAAPGPAPVPSTSPTPSPSVTPTQVPTSVPLPTPSPSPLPPNPPRAEAVAPGVGLLSEAAAADVIPRTLLRDPATRPTRAPKVRSEAREAVSLVVPGLRPGVRYQVSLSGTGVSAALGTATADADGETWLPVFRVRKAGSYLISLEPVPRGPSRYIRLNVS